VNDPRPAPPRRTFDGVICFGGVDWWYHNRGHYDLQMMRELSRTVPVLYVNSIAMRVPKLSEGGMFFKRVRRKLASLGRGMSVVRPTFGVFSPFVLPGRLGTTLSRVLAPRQIGRAARRLGIQRPLVWVACPPAARFLDSLHPVGLVYQRTDRFETFTGVDAAFIGACNDALVAHADIVLYCSRLLMEEETGHTPNALFLDHGVDFEVFRAAGESDSSPPADVERIPRPRVGFVGGIDAHTFDPPLFCRTAELLPDVQFVLVGASSLPEGWCTAPNVTLLGQRPYEEVAGYMASSDVLIMPWNESEWIRACNPVKLKEYLAVGRPIVSTDFCELGRYQGLVRVARGPEAFAAEIRHALDAPVSPRAGRERVREETWENKARTLLHELASRGIEIAGQ